MQFYSKKNAQLEKELEQLRDILSSQALSKTFQNVQRIGMDRDTCNNNGFKMLEKPLQNNLCEMNKKIRMLELQSLENERLIQTMGRLVSLEDIVSSKVRNVSNEAANSTNGVANIMAHSVHMEDKMTGTQDFDDIEGETVIEVSKYITRRNLWWRAFNFARCPNCRKNVKCSIGVIRSQEQVSKADEDVESHAMGVFKPNYTAETNDSTEVELESEGISHGQMKQQVTNDLRFFLSNLPASVTKIQPKSIVWLIECINDLYNKKTLADKSDLQDGLPIQSFF